MKKYKAPAKINLFLQVLGKREDGFHELFMLMEKIPLYDVLYISKRERGVKVHSTTMVVEQDNLIYRAAQKYFSMFNIEGGMTCQLEKNIPMGAGLGGGSSDAATTLIALRDLYQKGTDEQLSLLAAELGSDVPFFLKKGACIARGRGEKLEEVSGPSLPWILLVKPPYGLSTAEVYKNLRREDIFFGGPEICLDYYRKKDLSFILYSYNDLEKPAFRLCPPLASIKKTLGEGALMSGSGTTVFKICASREEAQALSKALPRGLDTWILKGNL